MSKKWDERKRDVDSKDSSNHKKKGSFGQKLEAAFNKLFGKESSHNSSKSHAEKEGTLYERKPSAVPSQTMKLDLKPSAMKDAKFDEREREYSEVKSLKPKTLSKKKTTPAQIHEGGLREERDIVIGFDLGTSCTKVILQDRQLKKCYAVPFQELGHEANKYLLPSKIFICKDGRLSLDVGDYEYKRTHLSKIA